MKKMGYYRTCKWVLHLKVDTENIEIIGTITNKIIAITLNGYIILYIKHDCVFVKKKTILTI